MGSVVITHYGVCDTNCCTKDFGCLTLLPTVSARLNLSLELCVPPPLALESKKIKRFSPRTEVEPATNVQNKNFYCSYSVIPDPSTLLFVPHLWCNSTPPGQLLMGSNVKCYCGPQCIHDLQQYLLINHEPALFCSLKYLTWQGSKHNSARQNSLVRKHEVFTVLPLSAKQNFCDLDLVWDLIPMEQSTLNSMIHGQT